MYAEMTLEEFKTCLSAGDDDGTHPVLQTLELLSGKWRPYVIYVLIRTPVCRFGELKRMIPGITNAMLTSTLRDLAALGIVHREQFNEVPPHVEYSLTEKGTALLPIIHEMAKWGEQYLD